jgi:hypothetical protein
VASDIEVTVSVSSPRRKFDEIETWHWWEVATEGERLSISSGGHFYRPSTGGDSFTTMTWTAIPEEASDLEDYRESLWMVPDVRSFHDGVASIDFAVGGYTVEVTDEDNALLGDDESDAEEELEAETEPSIELSGTGATDEPVRGDINLPRRALPTTSPGRVCFEKIVHGPIFTRKDVMDFAGVPAARLDSWLKKRLIHFRNESQEGSARRNWNLYEFLQVKILDVFCGDGNVSPESVNNAASVAADVIVTDVLGFGAFVDNREETYRPDFGQDRFVISGPYHPMVTPADTTLWDIRRQLVSTTWTALDMNLLAQGVTVPAIADLINLFRNADEHGEDLRLLGALAPDLLYIRTSELQIFDRWTRVYAAMVPQLLLDQLRVRGVSSFYVLDNSIREDRFDALVKIFSDVGYSVISPNLDGASEAEVLDRIDSAQVLRKHILYVERDASVNCLDAVRGIQKRPWYTVAFRNQAPTLNSVEILQLAGGR